MARKIQAKASHAGRLITKRVRSRKPRNDRDSWEQRWSSSSYLPFYEIGEADVAVARALADGWFSGGMRAIDIGCGFGHNAAFLARHGLGAIGVDFAPSAVRRAEERYGDIPGLDFDVVDVLQPGSFAGTFDVLIDRGCLHGIEPRARPQYVASVVSWAKPGARFLLIMRTKGAEPRAVVAEAVSLFEPYFACLSFDLGDVASTRSIRSLPSVAMRLVRSPG